MKPSALSVAALAFAAACGGNGDDGGNTSESPSLPDGETLPAHNHVAAVLSEGGTVRLSSWDELHRLSLENDDLADGDVAIIRLAEDRVAVIHLQTPSPVRARGYFVTGNHTPYDALGGTATYEGVAATLEFHDPGDDGEHWNRTTWGAENGRLAADFEAGTISGRFDEWKHTSGERVNGEYPVLDALVTFEPAPITRNGFQGEISVAGTAIDPTGKWSAQYEGSFYGPDAEDAAGVLRGTWQTETSGADQVIGWFATAGPFAIDLDDE